MGLIEVVRERNWRILPEPCATWCSKDRAPSSVPQPVVRETPAQATRVQLLPPRLPAESYHRAGPPPLGGHTTSDYDSNGNPDPGLMWVRFRGARQEPTRTSTTEGLVS
jgi:hypothetical protein